MRKRVLDGWTWNIEGRPPLVVLPQLVLLLIAHVLLRSGGTSAHSSSSPKMVPLAIVREEYHEPGIGFQFRVRVRAVL